MVSIIAACGLTSSSAELGGANVQIRVDGSHD